MSPSNLINEKGLNTRSWPDRKYKVSPRVIAIRYSDFKTTLTVTCAIASRLSVSYIIILYMLGTRDK